MRGCVLLSVVLASAMAKARPPLPHIVFLLADDLGFGDVGFTRQFEVQPGANGQPYVLNPPRTPNLDALALSSSAILFSQYYAGSAVCSPTRASLLTGRTPQRDCIDTAEGCGQKPAWSCFEELPLPPETWTVAEAAKLANYSTAFVGKFHLGSFWDKAGDPHSTPAAQRWHASHPGMHGFDEWLATEASAESSTPNCGCVADWKQQGQGCIVGGGYWTHNDSLACTNYWGYANASSGSIPACTDPSVVPRSCVANLTAKIEGDDTEFIMNTFQQLLQRHHAKNAGLPADQQQRLLVFLHLHTNHVPHKALPEFYHAYNDSNGRIAGDYLGTITQMDHALGQYSELLRQFGMDQDTLTFFSADNGPHTLGSGTSDRDQEEATLGRRQCKASLFQGGVLEPSFAHWPAAITSHRVVRHASSTLDLLPTFLDLAGLNGSSNPNPSWPIDGVSLAPLLLGEVGDNSSRPRLMPFAQSGQWAVLNQTDDGRTWKLLTHPEKGQCQRFDPPWGNVKNPCADGCLFEIESDPSETKDVCGDYPDVCASLRAALSSLMTSVETSRTNETRCAVQPTPSPVPPPPTPPTSGFSLVQPASGKCLTVASMGLRGPAVLGSCDGGSKWSFTSPGKHLRNEDASGNCLKLDQENYPGCKLGVPTWMGNCQLDSDAAGVTFDASTGHLSSLGCSNVCIGLRESDGAFVTADCSNAIVLARKD